MNLHALFRGRADTEVYYCLREDSLALTNSELIK